MNLVVDARAVRKDVQMVGCRRAARQHEFDQPYLRADLYGLRRQFGPDRIEELQPVEKRQPTTRADPARQGEQVVEHLGVLGQRVRQREAVLDAGLDLPQDLAEALVVGLR